MPDQGGRCPISLETDMPLLADKTITVRNLHYDPETDTETAVSTLLKGCSVHAKTVASATADGLAAASIAQIRIFAGHTLATPQSVTDAAVPAESKYLAPVEWSAQSAAAATDTWTLRPGDHINYEGQQMTVLAVHDNRGARRNPHWYIEAH